jgi:hypothetical protein
VFVCLFFSAKEFVTPQSGPQQQAEILHIALSIIRASILSMNLSHVKTQVQRAMRTVKEMQLSGGGGGAQPMALSSPTSGGGGAAAASAAGAAGAGGNNADKNERELNIITSKLHAAHGLFHLKSQFLFVVVAVAVVRRSRRATHLPLNGAPNRVRLLNSCLVFFSFKYAWCDVFVIQTVPTTAPPNL